MGNLVRSSKYWLALAVLCLAGSAFAGPLTVTLDFTGTGGSAPLGYAYIYPYYFNISPAVPSTAPGTNVAMACDDFTDEITYGESWQTLVTSLPNASSSNTYFFGKANYEGDSGLTSYEEAAWLAEQLESPHPIAPMGDIQWALWGLFDGSNGAFNANFLGDFNTFGIADKNEISTLLADAKNDHGSAASYSNVYIYTPVTVDSNGAITVRTDNGRPQEFLRVVPETSTLALLGIGLAGLAALLL